MGTESRRKAKTCAQSGQKELWERLKEAAKAGSVSETVLDAALASIVIAEDDREREGVKMAAVGATLIMVCKSLQTRTKGTRSDAENCTRMAGKCLDMLIEIRHLISFKAPFPVEMICTAYAGSLLGVGEWQLADFFVEKCVRSLRQSGAISVADDSIAKLCRGNVDENEKELWPRMVSLVTTCMYNKMRFYVETESFREGLEIASSRSFREWLSALFKSDPVKFQETRHFISNLLSRHAPNLLEAKEKFKDAFSYQTLACKLLLSLPTSGEKGEDKENESASGSQLEKIVDMACVACKRLTKALGPRESVLKATLSLLSVIDERVFQDRSVKPMKRLKNGESYPVRPSLVAEFIEKYAQNFFALGHVERAQEVVLSALRGDRSSLDPVSQSFCEILYMQLETKFSIEKCSGALVSSDWDSSAQNVLKLGASEDHWYLSRLEKWRESFKYEATKGKNQSGHEQLKKLVHDFCKELISAMKEKQLKDISYASQIIERLVSVVVDGQLVSTPSKEFVHVLARSAEVMFSSANQIGEELLDCVLLLLKKSLELSVDSTACQSLALATSLRCGVALFSGEEFARAVPFLELAFSVPSNLLYSNRIRILGRCLAKSGQEVEARRCLVEWIAWAASIHVGFEVPSFYDSCSDDRQEDEHIFEGKSSFKHMGEIITEFCSINFHLARASRRGFSNLIDEMRECAPDLINLDCFLCEILPTLIRKEVDGYLLLCCNEPEAAELLHKLQDSSLGSAMDVLASLRLETPEHALRLEIERTRILWFRYFHAVRCPDCGSYSEEWEETWARQLQRGHELCFAIHRRIEEFLRTADQEQGLNLLPAFFNQWAGIISFSENHLCSDDGEDGYDHSYTKRISRDALTQLRRSVEAWKALLHEPQSFTEGIVSWSRLICWEEIEFLSKWAEYSGISNICLSSAGLLLELSEEGTERDAQLFKLARVTETKLGNSSLAKALYQSTSGLSDSLAASIRSTFFVYEFLEDGLEMQSEGNAIASDLQTLLEFTKDLEQSVATCLETLDRNKGKGEHELEAQLQYVLSCLQSKRGEATRQAIENAVTAVEKRARMDRATEGPFSQTGVQWNQVFEFGECLKLTGQLFERIGNPRMAKSYFEKGRSLGDLVGSPALLNEFLFLKFRLGLKTGEIQDAATTLQAVCPEVNPISELQLAVAQALLSFYTSNSSEAKQHVSRAETLLQNLLSSSQDVDATKLVQWTKAPHQEKGTAVSNISMMLAEAKVELLLLKVKLGMDERGVGNFNSPLFVKYFCESIIDRVQHFLREDDFNNALTAVDEGLRASVLGGVGVDLTRSLFRLRSMTLLRSYENKCACQWEVAYCFALSFGLHLSSELLRILEPTQSNSRAEIHRAYSLPLEQGAAIYRQKAADSLPDGWAVVSMAVCENSCAQHELLVSRTTRLKENSVCISIPLDKNDLKIIRRLRTVIEECESTAHAANSSTEKEWTKSRIREWWENRQRVNTEMGELLHNLDLLWFPDLQFLFKPPQKNDAGAKSDVLLQQFHLLCKTCDSLPGVRNMVFPVFREICLYISGQEDRGTCVGDTVECLRRVFNIPVEIAQSFAKQLVDTITPISKNGVFKSAQSEVLATLFPSDEEIEKMKVIDLKTWLGKYNLPTSGLKKVLIERLKSSRPSESLDNRAKQLPGSLCRREADEDQHVILVLSDELQHIPFEHFGSLKGRSFSRMPSLAFVLDKLSTFGPYPLINGENVSYLVDPDGDLEGTRSTLQPFLEGLEKSHSWDGRCGPSEKSVLSGFLDKALRQSDMILYCGHGGAEHILAREQVARLQDHCAVALLMGCSSGKLKLQGQFESTGLVLAYMLGASPAVVGTLWDVTDKDIDRFTQAVIERWVSQCEPKPLSQVVQEAKSVCKMEYLVGAAIIYIGLPVRNRCADSG